MRSAVDRVTQSGDRLGPDEALSEVQAMRLFMTPLDEPGGIPRRIKVGVPADICLLDRPLRLALIALSSGAVRLTILGGQIVYER
jgi:predicted amidohydrolase YtcJ